MATRVLNRRIIALALPFLAANISVPLLGLVDTAVLGHLESEKYLGAIALGSMIFNFLFWGFSFLKMGTTGFTAQAKGRSDRFAVSMVLKRGCVTAVLIGVVVILLQKPVWLISEYFMHGSDELLSYAYDYFSIRIYSAPAVFLLYVLTGWFLGMQNAVFVLYVTIIENVANIVLNLLFVLVFGMRTDGVALGTVFAQYLALGFAVVVIILRYRKDLIKMTLARILNLNEMLLYFRVNIDIMIRTVALMFAFAFFTIRSSSVNDVLLASNMILLQFMLFFSYVTDGFAHAGESLSGFFHGAGKKKSLVLLIRKLFLWSFMIALLFSAIYLVFFRNIIQLLTDQYDVIMVAKGFKWWLVAIPLISFSAYLWDGIYIGMTKTSYLRNAMLMSLIFVFLPSYYIGVIYISEHALWLSMMLFMLSRGMLLWLFSKKAIFEFNPHCSKKSLNFLIL